MLSVGVVVPTWHYFADPFKLQPLWELYFATLIDARFSENEVRAEVIDLRDTRLENTSMKIDGLAEFVSEKDVFFYWIMKTADYPEVLRTMSQLREAYPHSKHVAGATHVDNFSDECASKFDAIILGPGDESLINIINDIRHNRLQKTYKEDWRQRKYADYPFARRHYLPERAIVNRDLFGEHGSLLGTSAMLQRGCSFRCAFCVYNVPGYIQMKTNDSIEEEIEYLKREYHIEGLNLRDEIAIPLAPKLAQKFLEALGRGNIKWRGQTKVGANKDKMVTREILKLASESGCVELAIGVESASQQVMDIIDKKQDTSQVRDFVDACQEFGIKVKMCFILGLPGEPPNIVEVTRNFIEETKPDYVAVSGFCPVPGSAIYKNPEYFGVRKIYTQWEQHAHLVYRFKDEETFGLPFEYEETNRWGRAFSREEIVNNIIEIQSYLRERSMIY